jgi:CO/xanthine dehydrogenase FAD-binding subunit
LTERPAVTVTVMLTVSAGRNASANAGGPAAGGPAAGGPAVAEARLVVGSVGSTPFAAGTAVLTGASAGDFEARATACAEQAAAGCAPLPDGEASADYLRHLVFIHARQALREAFAAA